MKRALVIWFFVAALVAMGCSPPPDSFGSVGTLQDSWIEIWDWYDLDAVRNDLSGSYMLMTDLDSTTAGYGELAGPTANDGKGWEPIGYILVDPEWVWVSFQGTFDGGGHEIRDLLVRYLGQWGVGLFGAIGQHAIIRDISIVNASVGGFRHVGALAGENRGNVSNSYSTGSVTGQGEVGGLVGHNVGSVRDSSSAASVAGTWMIGGLVGWINTPGTISNSYSTGSVTGEQTVGGLVGLALGAVSNSHYNYDKVLINGQNIITIGALFDKDFEEWLANDRFLDASERLSEEDGYYLIDSVGAFKELLAFGQDSSLKFRLTNDLDLATEPNFYIPYLGGEFDGNGHRILNVTFSFDRVSQVGLFGCVPYGGRVTRIGAENVEITGASHVGGLVGQMNGGIVSDSYSTGSVTGSSRVGGLMGFNMGGPVSNSYSTASATGDSSDAGGLIGDNRGQVDTSYSSGSVIGYWSVGGLIGLNLGPVSGCYATGSVVGTSGGKYVGGLVGRNQYGTVSNSFWDIETSGMDVSDGGTGKTTAEMKDIATFLDAGWDIVAVGIGQRNRIHIWNIVDGQTYPFLSWQPIS